MVFCNILTLYSCCHCYKNLVSLGGAEGGVLLKSLNTVWLKAASRYMHQI